MDFSFHNGFSDKDARVLCRCVVVVVVVVVAALFGPPPTRRSQNESLRVKTSGREFVRCLSSRKKAKEISCCVLFTQMIEREITRRLLMTEWTLHTLKM